MKSLVNRFFPFSLAILLSIQVSAQKEVAGQVYFNHLWVAIPSEDWKAIQDSEFITTEFGATDMHTSKTASGDEWSGIYFYGTNNYFEFLDEDAQHIQSGSSGLGFSVEQAGQLKHLKKELHHDFGKNVHHAKQTKLEGSEKVNWFQTLFVNDEVHFEDTALYYWVQEYSPDYFEKMGLPLDEDKKEVTTVSYLSKWEEARQDKFLQHVTGITVDLHHNEYLTFTKFLSAIGFRKTSQHTYGGPDGFEIRVEELDVSTPTITSIRMAMAKEVDEDKMMAFGENTSLHLRTDGTAEWVFK